MHILSIALSALLAVMQQGAASVEGIVVKMGSAEPIAGARVELHPEKDAPRAGEQRSPDAEPPPRPEVYTVTTSQDGKFAFNNVLPATYRLVATRSNFVPGEYGQRTATMQGIPLDVTAGQRMTGIQLAMAPTASIAGRVYDREGEPVGKAQVQALRSVYKNGRRTLTIVQTVETNDRGEYRLFWLAPGRYYVSAKPDIPELPVDMRSGNGSTMATIRVTDPARFGTYEQASNPVIRKRKLKSGEVVEETYLPVYYPGVVETQAALPVTLSAGAAVAGIDVSVGYGVVPARHIRGRVINAADGQPLEKAAVMAIPRAAEPLLAIPIGESGPNGLFDIAGATAGAYIVVASGKTGSGIVPVDVGDADVQNLAIVTTAGFSVLGKFAAEGRARPGTERQVTDFRVDRFIRDLELPGLPPAGPSFNPPAQPDGSFKLDGVAAGDFRLTVRTGSEDTYIKSMRMGNADVLDAGLHLAGPPENPLEIVVGVNAGRINGSVVNARGEPLSNRNVVLIPDLRLRHRNDLYRTVSTDSAGRFRMRGIAPGGYQLFAWENVETGAWQDPEFLRAYEGRGKAIQIDEGGEENVQLTVIP